MTLATPTTVDTRFGVTARAADPQLRRRTTSFVSRRHAVLAAVAALRDELLGLLASSG